MCAEQLEEVALGFVAVANEAMCRPIRALTQAKGYDIQHHTLACFGGAGGQHASAIARNLGIHSIFIHRFSGILSAYGMGLADIVHEKQEPCALTYDPSTLSALQERVQALAGEATAVLVGQGFRAEDVEVIAYLNLRYDGTDTAIMTRSDSNSDYDRIFERRYQREYGFTLDRPIRVDDIRVRVIGKSRTRQQPTLRKRREGEDVQYEETKTYFAQGWMDTRVYQLSHLLAGDEVAGPAMIIDNTSTILVEPGCSASITSHGDVLIIVGNLEVEPVSTALDSIQLSIFSHRFMSIAEQMGPHPPAHLRLHQHQRASRLLVRTVWTRWRPRRQRAPSPRPSRRHAGGGAVPGEAVGGRVEGRGRGPLQPSSGWRLSPA